MLKNGYNREGKKNKKIRWLVNCTTQPFLTWYTISCDPWKKIVLRVHKCIYL